MEPRWPVKVVNFVKNKQGKKMVNGKTQAYEFYGCCLNTFAYLIRRFYLMFYIHPESLFLRDSNIRRLPFPPDELSSVFLDPDCHSWIWGILTDARSEEIVDTKGQMGILQSRRELQFTKRCGQTLPQLL